VDLLQIITLPRPGAFIDFEEPLLPGNNFYREQEETWPQLRMAVQNVPWMALTFLDEAIDIAILKNYYREQEEPWVTQTTTVSWLSVTFLDEDPEARLGFDLEEPWVTQITTITWLARPFTDEAIDLTTLANFYREQEEPWITQVTVIPWLGVSFLDEDPETRLGFDQEEPWVAQTTVIPWLPRPFTDESPDTALLTNFYREQEEFWTAQTTNVPWLSVVFADEDPEARLGFDQEEPWVTQITAIPWLALPFKDEAIDLAVLANFYREQEEPWVGAVTTIPWLGVAFLDESTDIALLSNFYREQEEFWTAQVTSAPWLAITFLDEDPEARLGFDLEEPWAGAIEVIPWTSRHFLDESPDTALLANFYREQEEPWVGAVESILWLPRPFADDEISSFATLGVDQEDAWPQLVESILWAPRPSLDEAIDTASLANFPREQEEPWGAQATVAPWTSLPFRDDDTISVAPATLGLDQEEPWLTQVQTIAWLARPYLDEAIDTATLANFYREQEDGWPALVTTTVWTASPSRDDETRSFAAALDQEESWQTQTQTLTWTARVAFEDEVVATALGIDLEEPWLAAIQSAPWLPVSFSDTESLFFATITLSGKVYLQDGTTPAGAGISVAAAVNGGPIAGTALTDTDSVYTISVLQPAAGTPLAVYLQNTPPEGGTVTTSTGASLSNLDINEHTLIPRSDGGMMTNAILAQANNGDADLVNVYNVFGSALTVANGNSLLLPLGNSFAPGDDIKMSGGGFVKLSGTFTAGTNSLTFQGGFGTSLLDTGGNTLYNLNASGGVLLALQSNVVLGGTLNFNSSTLDVSASNFSIAVAGNWNAGAGFSPGAFIARQGTVTFNGTNQSIRGQTTFWNLVKQVTTADTWTFQAGNLTTILNRFTATGVPGGFLAIRSDTMGSQFQIQSPTTHNVAYVSVRDSDNSLGVLVDPANSVDLGNNINWFPPPPPIPTLTVSMKDMYNPGRSVVTTETPGTLPITGSGSGQPSGTPTLDGNIKGTYNPSKKIQGS
jgi:hypothetical protein